MLGIPPDDSVGESGEKLYTYMRFVACWFILCGRTVLLINLFEMFYSTISTPTSRVVILLYITSGALSKCLWMRVISLSEL